MWLPATTVMATRKSASSRKVLSVRTPGNQGDVGAASVVEKIRRVVTKDEGLPAGDGHRSTILASKDDPNWRRVIAAAIRSPEKRRTWDAPHDVVGADVLVKGSPHLGQVLGRDLDVHEVLLGPDGSKNVGSGRKLGSFQMDDADTPGAEVNGSTG